MFLTSRQSHSMFLTSCQFHSMFLTGRFRSLRAADSSPLLRPSTPASNVLQLCGSSLSSSIRAFPSGPSVSSPCQHGFRLPALSRWSDHVVPLPLAPTRLGYGNVSLAPLHVLRRSPWTLWHPLAQVALPSLTCQQPLPLSPELSMHSWSMRRTPLRLSLCRHHILRCR